VAIKTPAGRSAVGCLVGQLQVVASENIVAVL